MAVESADDRATFVDTEEFGVEATYAPVTGSPVTINGIYDAPHLSRDLGGDGPALSDVRRTFLCDTDELPAGAVGGDAGDTLTIDGATYRVVDLQPDGTGMTLLTLGK